MGGQNDHPTCPQSPGLTVHPWSSDPIMAPESRPRASLLSATGICICRTNHDSPLTRLVEARCAYVHLPFQPSEQQLGVSYETAAHETPYNSPARPIIYTSLHHGLTMPHDPAPKGTMLIHQTQGLPQCRSLSHASHGLAKHETGL
jgi:hypothetical protein